MLVICLNIQKDAFICPGSTGHILTLLDLTIALHRVMAASARAVGPSWVGTLMVRLQVTTVGSR